MISRKKATPRLALIGVTGYACMHVNWLLKAHSQGLVKLVAVVALEENLQHSNVLALGKLGAKVYCGYEELFADQTNALDLCVICTGIHWHSRMAIAALESGCNVLLEKPLAGSLTDGMAIVEAERRTGHWVAVGFQTLYTKALCKAKQAILNGQVGAIRSVSMIGAWPRTLHYYSRNGWAGKRIAEGAAVFDSPLNNAFAHFVVVALYLAGARFDEACSVEVRKAQLLRSRDIETFDTALVSADSVDGIRFWFGATHSCSSTINPVVRIVGDDGVLEWTHEKHCCIRSLGGNEERWWSLVAHETNTSDMYSSVLNRLHESGTHICSTRIALCHTALVDSIHRIWRVGDVDSSLVEVVTDPSTGGIVPAIINIEDQLKLAWKSFSETGNAHELQLNIA